ncbi:MAG: hypothetical protein IT289_02545 [Oligoflexia bacterium]|nr:hypothetical protein [Oligoflexia bacterium]
MKTIVILFMSMLIGLFSFEVLGASFAPKSKKFSGYREGTWGLGVIAGEPSLARVQYYSAWKRALSFSAGYSIANRVVLGSADYLFYFFDAQDRRLSDNFWNSLMLYLGPGVLGGVGVSGSDPNDNYQIGFRGTFGVEYVITQSPWSVNLEVAPTLYAKSKNSFGVGVGIGVLYHFGGHKSAPSRFKEKNAEDFSEFD